MSGGSPSIDDMPTVFMRESSKTFHRTSDCVQLLKKPARGRTQQPMVELDLADLNRPVPCRVCYPDAPRMNFVRRYCPKCNKGKVYPCAHNGGVKVTLTYTTGYVGLLRDPGDPVYKPVYVWPDRVHFYEPIAS